MTPNLVRLETAICCRSRCRDIQYRWRPGLPAWGGLAPVLLGFPSTAGTVAMTYMVRTRDSGLIWVGQKPLTLGVYFAALHVTGCVSLG